jgi:hypothetical protein
MRKKSIIFFILAISMASLSLTGCTPPIDPPVTSTDDTDTLIIGTTISSGAPEILFTDVEYGPKTGGPNNLGVPITLFGKGFGASRGSSKVTIGGVEVGSYMVWGQNNAHNTTLDMIVVQPGENVSGGAIQITINNLSSNTDLKFTPNAGKIYYVSTTGSDSAVCSEMAPCKTIGHSALDVMKPGDTVLVRGGTYQDGEVWFKNGGTPTAPKTIKRYPGETVNLANGSKQIIVNSNSITLSGFNFQNGKTAGVWADTYQSGDRFIDNTFTATTNYEAITSYGDNHLLAGNVCQVAGEGTQDRCSYTSSGQNSKIIYNIGEDPAPPPVVTPPAVVPPVVVPPIVTPPVLPPIVVVPPPATPPPPPPVVVGPPPPITGSPVLNFSDLTWGVKTGWEGSSTKGAAVTIWGTNFGAARNGNYVTVNGAQLMNDADYSEWGIVGPTKNIQRITFWINNTATDGAGEITVTINGIKSNPLPFNITNGTIYFVSVTDGDNANNGLRSTNQGSGNGPFKDLCMFNPGLDGATSCHNPSGDGQYIMYIKSGTYTKLDVDSTFIALRGPYGGPAKQKALIGFPGETHIIDSCTSSAHGGSNRGIIWSAGYISTNPNPPQASGFNNYFTFSKINGVGGQGAIGVIGDYTRVIGSTFKDYREPARSGVIFVAASKNTAIYGNLFDNCGDDSMKHNIYVKTQLFDTRNDLSTENTDIGWNEFANPYASDTHGGVIFISKDGASAVSQYQTRNTHIHHNYFHDGNQDFFYFGDGHTIGTTYLYNNIFSGGTGSMGGLVIYFNDKIHLYNNLFYKTGRATHPMMFVSGPNTRAIFANNIWYARPNQGFLKLESYNGATFTSNNDLFYSETGASLPGGGGTTVTNSLNTNPLLVDPENGNFALSSASPALKTGTDIITSFPKLNATLPSYPEGTVFNIGPYE